MIIAVSVKQPLRILPGQNVWYGTDDVFICIFSKEIPELWVWDVWRKYFGFHWPVIMVTHMNKIIHNPWDICIIRRIYCIHSSSDILYTQFIRYAIFMKIRHPCGLCAVYIVGHTCWGGNLNAVTQHLSVINPEAKDFYSFLSCVCVEHKHYRDIIWASSLIAMFMGPIWGPSRADRTQVGPMLAPWTLLSGIVSQITNNSTVLFNSVFKLTSNKTSKLYITGPHGIWGFPWSIAIHLWIPNTNGQFPVDFPHKGPVIWKAFPWHGIVMLVRRQSKYSHLFDKPRGTNVFVFPPFVFVMNIEPVNGSPIKWKEILLMTFFNAFSESPAHRWNFCQVCFWGLTISQHWFRCGLVPSQYQAINWNIDDLFHWCMYSPRGIVNDCYAFKLHDISTAMSSNYMQNIFIR